MTFTSCAMFDGLSLPPLLKMFIDHPGSLELKFCGRAASLGQEGRVVVCPDHLLVYFSSIDCS